MHFIITVNWSSRFRRYHISRCLFHHTNAYISVAVPPSEIPLGCHRLSAVFTYTDNSRNTGWFTGRRSRINNYIPRNNLPTKRKFWNTVYFVTGAYLSGLRHFLQPVTPSCHGDCNIWEHEASRRVASACVSRRRNVKFNIFVLPFPQRYSSGWTLASWTICLHSSLFFIFPPHPFTFILQRSSCTYSCSFGDVDFHSIHPREAVCLISERPTRHNIPEFPSKNWENAWKF
jgi:hypothetical protein